MKRCEYGHLADDDQTVCSACGSDGFFPEPGALVDGKYVVERELGRGAMGLVYLARDLGLGRRVALKLISSTYARDSIMLERFKREAQALAALRNEHVVQIFALGHLGVFPYFIMEYVPGQTLETIIDEHAAHSTFVPLRLALRILRQVALGLAAVHRARLVHRDVKPANVIIEEDSGRPVLIDFGLVRIVSDAEHLRRTAAAGTPLYMAPEQHSAVQEVEAHRITARTDVYALGCAGFELLTGQPPFVATDAGELRRQQATRPPPLLSHRRPELLPLDQTFEQALARNADERFADCDEFVAALDAASGSLLAEPSRRTGPRERRSLRPPPRLARMETQGEEPRYPTTGPSVAPPSPGAAPVFPRVPDAAPLEGLLAGPVRVLVVDDDPHFRRFAEAALKIAFQDVQHEVHVATSGEDGLERFASLHPHLVVLDFDMPELDGIGTLSALRLLPHGYDTKVLVVSANVRGEQRWRFSVLGVRDFLDKPVGLDRLAKAARAIAERSEWVSGPRSMRP